MVLVRAQVQRWLCGEICQGERAQGLNICERLEG